MNRVYLAFCGFAFSALLGGATLADTPSLGLVYGQKETHSLTYSCVEQRGMLECEFVQVAVRSKAKAEELNQALEKARKEFSKMTKNEMTSQCAQSANWAAAFRDGITPPGADAKEFQKGLASMTQLQKTDTTKLFDRLEMLCRDPSEENFLAITRHTHDVETRTCSVSSHSYQQSFKKVDDSETWVVQDSPSGPCGVVNVSRFEKEKSSITGISFWNYFAKKVVTNKSGKIFEGFACSELDETEYEYNWRSKDAQLGCDYISFGAI